MACSVLSSGSRTMVVKMEVLIALHRKPSTWASVHCWPVPLLGVYISGRTIETRSKEESTSNLKRRCVYFRGKRQRQRHRGAGGSKDLKEPTHIKILNEVTREIFESSKSKERGKLHISRLPELLERSAGLGTKMTNQERRCRIE